MGYSPLKYIEYGFGYIIVRFPPTPYSIYLRGTVGLLYAVVLLSGRTAKVPACCIHFGTPAFRTMQHCEIPAQSTLLPKQQRYLYDMPCYCMHRTKPYMRVYNNA